MKRTLHDLDPEYFERPKLTALEFFDTRIEEIPVKAELIPQVLRAKFARCHLTNVPPGLIQYHYIKVLDLSENLIEEIKDGELEGFILLQYLDLSLNNIIKISPNLPSSIIHLDLSYNPKIDIESVFSINLPNLDILKLAHCNLHELPNKMPPWGSNIKNLSLDGNYFTVFPEILKSFPKLDDISLFGNSITHFSYPEGMHDMKTLNLSMNPLETIDNNFSGKLQTLYLNYVLLKTIPDDISQLKTIKVIMLSNCQIEGEIQFEVPNQLAILDLSNNKITSLSTKFIKSLALTSVVNLQNNLIEEIPDEFPETLAFSQILLSRNKLKTLPPSILQSKSIEKLVVSHNQLESLPEFKLGQLREFDVSFNKLKSIPNCFISCNFLVSVNVSFNELEDLPQSLSHSRRLLDLYAAHNKFTVIPKAILGMASLRTLILSMNRLTILHPSLNYFFFLKTLDISNNHFVAIPKEIEQLKTLKYLSVSHNLIDTIPESFEFPNSLTFLDLSFNLIKEFPRSISNLQHLLALNISCNQIPKRDLTNNTFLHYYSDFGNNISADSTDYSKLKNLRIVESFANIPKIEQVEAESQPLSKSSTSLAEGTSSNATHSSVFNKLPLETEESSLPEQMPSNGPVARQRSNTIYKKPDFVFFQNRRNSISSFPYRTHSSIDTKKSRCHSMAPLFYDKNFNIGYSAMLGPRPTMEDAVTITSCTDHDILVSLFDGHAGFGSAKWASKYIFKEYHSIYDKPLNEIPELLQKSLKNIEERLYNSDVDGGCTCAIAVITNGNVFTIGVGDSRIVRVKKNSYERITTDFKPMSKTEFARLKECGLGVSVDGRICRKLAVARSLGDFWCPNYEGLFQLPDVNHYQIDPEEDLGIIVACDGLWDVIDDDYASQIVREAKTAEDAAITLKNCGLALSSNDNISVCVILFRNGGFQPFNTVERIPVLEEPKEEDNFLAPVVMTRGRSRR